MNRIFSHAFSSAGVPTILQPPGISRDDGKRPMTVTLTPSYINESSKKPCSIEDNAERIKHIHFRLHGSRIQKI